MAIPSADDPAARAELLEQLQRETERIRGLSFLEPVDATFLTDEEFRAQLADVLEDDLEGGNLVEVERIWQALGLIEPDVDLAQVLRQALGEGVLGYYDPETDELVMRGVELDFYTQSTLVHELTHALDDQHFDLHRPDLDDSDDTEAQFAFTGLAEGSASWVENRWVASLSTEEAAELQRAEIRFGASADLTGIPEVLLVDLSLPYVLGPAFVAELVASGGTDAIDAAFLAPPLTGEQLYDPAEYLDEVPVVVVAQPPADGDVVDEGVLGASSLYEILLFSDPRSSTGAAAVWGGDAYVVWETGPDRACIRADIVGDDAAGTDLIADALGTYVATHDDASIERAGDAVRLTACG